MNRLREIFDIILIGIVVFIILIPFSIYLILTYPSRRLAHKNFENDYLEYANQLNGKNFFCYNNREHSKEFIESQVIPKLPENVEIIYLNGKEIESNYSRKFISHAFRQFKNYSKFPHLMKIRNGEIFDKSLNNTFYNMIYHKLPLDKLLNEMNLFFNVDE